MLFVLDFFSAQPKQLGQRNAKQASKEETIKDKNHVNLLSIPNDLAAQDGERSIITLDDDDDDENNE